MTTAEERELACELFDTDEYVGYIVLANVDGDRVYCLYDSFGEIEAITQFGLTPLLSYAANHGITLFTVH